MKEISLLNERIGINKIALEMERSEVLKKTIHFNN